MSIGAPEATTQDARPGADAPAPDSSGRGRLGPLVAEVGVYAVVVVLVCWPAPLHLTTRIIGAGDDARYYTWLAWRIGQLIDVTRPLPTHVPGVIVPFGLDLRLVDGYLPTYVAGVLNLVVGPITAFNVAMLTGTVLNLLAARALAARLSDRRIVVVVVAVAFVTAAPIALNVQLGLLPLYWAFTVPLLLADAIDVARGGRVRPVRLALLLLVAYLCSIYFLVFGGLMYGIVVLAAAVRSRSVAPLLRAGVAVVAVAVVLAPVVVARLDFDRAEEAGGGQPELLRDSTLYSSDLFSIVAQPTRSTVLLPRPDAVDRGLNRLVDPTYELEASAFPGLVLLVGFALFLTRRSRLRLPLLVAAIVLWVLALGPSLRVAGEAVWHSGAEPRAFLPYRLLLAVPGLGALRAPLRVAYELTAVLAAGTAVALHRLLRTGDRALAVGVVVVAGALLVPSLLIPLPTVGSHVSRSEARALRRVARTSRPGDSVVSVPADCDPTFVSAQVFHETPVAGCAGSFAANPWWSKMRVYAASDAFTKLRCDRRTYGRLDTKARALGPFTDADLRALRREFGVRFAIVDRVSLRGPQCVSTAAALPVLERHRHLGGDARYAVIDLAARERGSS